MKTFFSWLFRPWLLSLIGVIFLSLIIWFEAPLLAFNGKEPFASESVRWFWIGLCFALWAGYFIWQFLKAKTANLQLIKSISGADEKQAPNPEVEALGKRLQEALAVLRKSKSGKGGHYLYQLPWYMFVGAPGSGKTTALTQSGLKFPLAESMGKNALGGVGGTRNCDWWFTENAVLLDTAGRYTTQDSDSQQDKAAWDGFLQLLRKYRRRRPINGIIMVISVADLLQSNDAARKQLAQTLRERVKELHEKLAVSVPIYVMVSKCDLLAGFSEYYDNMGQAERAQVWGMTFATQQTADQALAQFPAEFKLLEQQLSARLVDRMQQERDVSRRALIFSFPQQFASLQDVLQPFLNEVFQSSRYQDSAQLRGIYFTSGTQQGSPIDRVMSAMAQAFGLNRQVLPVNNNSGRSYFITRLLEEVIFPEANLAGVNAQLERKRRLLHWGGIAAVALLSVLLIAGLITSYLRNQQLIEDTNQKVEQINKLAASVTPQSSLAQVLPLLNAVSALQHQEKPWSMRLGLYQGDKLNAGADNLYRKVLMSTLLPHIVKRMEQELQRGNANNPEYLYELLRVYMMLGDFSHFDAEAVSAWVMLDWESTIPDEAQRQVLSAHLLALMERYNQADLPPQLNTPLIGSTQLALAQMPIAQRVYNRLKRDLARDKLPEFSVAQAGGRDAAQVFIRRSGEPLTRGISGIFSVAGYQNFLAKSDLAIADIAKDSWVLAQQESSVGIKNIEQTKASLQQLYFDEYIAVWDKYLADVGIVRFANMEQGARVANILASADSPLRQFIAAAAKQTTLGGTPASLTTSLSDTVKDKLDAYKQRLASTIGTAAVTPAADKQLNPVDVHFEGLRKLTTASAGGAAPLDATLLMLKDVAVFLDAANTAKRAGTPPPSGDALNRLKLEASSKPPVLASLLNDVNEGGAGLALGGERERLNALWTASAAQFCRQAIAGRYPLVRGASQDVTQDDFGRFFAPGGLMDDFFQRNLLNYVDMGGKQWKWRSNTNNDTLGIPQEVLNQFQRAAQIRDAFFASGGRQPSMRFDLKPVSMDAGLSKVQLDIDGQSVPFTIGTSVPIQLPSGKGNGQVRLETLQTDGPWAWLRMVDKASMSNTAQAERFKLTFDLQGRKASYELTANSVINPFRREALEQFRCMEKL